MLIDISASLKYTLPMHFSKKDLYTVPNLLTYFRLLLVPVFCIVYLKSTTLAGHIWAIVVVLASGLSDVLDGIIARKTGQVTDLGKIIDPVADKAMQFAMLFCVVFKYHLVLILLIIYAVKELISLCFSSYLFAHDKNIGGAQWYGKLCTVILYIVMFIFIVVPNVEQPASSILIACSAAFMLLSFIMYMQAYIKMLIQLKKEPEEASAPSGPETEE